MPSYIVKCDRAEDFYVVWSSVTDSPHYWGPKDILLLEMHQSAGPDPDRFARADKTGSSALWPSPTDPIFGWSDSGFIYEQEGWLPRASLRALCDRLESDQDVADLLEPFED